MRTSISERRSVISIEEDESRANVEGEGIVPTVAQDLLVTLSGSQPVQTQEEIVEELLTAIPHPVYDALAQRLEVVSDVSVVENSEKIKIELMKEDGDRLLKEVNA